MTLNRRSFLQAGMGIGLARPEAACAIAGKRPCRAPLHGAAVPLDEYERILATGNHFIRLGRPRSWSVIQQGFLPISPERVLILEPKYVNGLADRWDWRDEQHRIRERMQKDAAAESPSCQNGHRRHAAETVSRPEKLGLILWLTNELTRYYAASEWWGEWAYNMTYREIAGVNRRWSRFCHATPISVRCENLHCHDDQDHQCRVGLVDGPYSRRHEALGTTRRPARTCHAHASRGGYPFSRTGRSTTEIRALQPGGPRA